LLQEANEIGKILVTSIRKIKDKKLGIMNYELGIISFLVRGLISIVQDCNFAPVQVAKPLYKVKKKSTQAVFMRHYNLGDFPFGYPFHQCQKLLTLKVQPRACIRNALTSALSGSLGTQLLC
jgi:hypothetical protein